MNSRKDNGATIVTISGRLDAASAPDFNKQFTDLIGQGEATFVLDFSDLVYISSAGLRSILLVAQELRKKSGKLLVVSLKDIVREVFEISGFIQLFQIFDSVDQALGQK
ncbi:MAG: STAS domain-containing protein [Candidatus Neomarinimicrobiota bacterium]